MWSYNNMDELYHYGILGMRWGVRRGRKSGSGIKTKKVKTPDSEDSKKLQNIKKKKVSQLTNQELRDANQRMQLESQYKDLRYKRTTGKKIVTAVVATGITLEGIRKTYQQSQWVRDTVNGAIKKISGK
jgi:hypothetical protein